MSAIIELLILYLVLFLPSIAPGDVFPEFVVFSVHRELTRILAYNIPAMALIWYLLYKTSIKSAGTGTFQVRRIVKPRVNDLIVFFISLPGLCIFGIGISMVSSFITTIFAAYITFSPGPQIEAPHGLLEWPVMVLSCLSTGYLEESFFRFYVLRRLEDAHISKGKSIFLSTLLFSLCHLYEGPWGTLNAALAGVFLSLVFFKWKSLHGIAGAHGGYNMFVYINGW